MKVNAQITVKELTEILGDYFGVDETNTTKLTPVYDQRESLVSFDFSSEETTDSFEDSVGNGHLF